MHTIIASSIPQPFLESGQSFVSGILTESPFLGFEEPLIRFFACFEAVQIETVYTNNPWASSVRVFVWGDNYKKKVRKMSNTWNQTRQMKRLAVGPMTTPEYNGWRSKRINDNIPGPS
ncbi:hypothetical protein PVK06_009119 [Gossypium arboreum]|uniref:Uncharacterized protein n=1 Tax=Gossypium arboreum TaxID=29729 RepID=A0ABR0QM29_GOSAR|nr:hypothetical protein PVK06_009119 [Gossypium arboreum]